MERERIERDRERAEQMGRIKMMHTDIDKLKATLMRKDQEIEELDKALKDCVAENDILFERFNVEIVKMAEAFRVDRGERELMEMLTGVREELGRVKRENM
jgi:predicted RNase H-like nuclease (RuvC/YqgF family)